MELVKPPEPLHFTGEISKQWKLFKQKFELFLVASAPDKKPRPDASKIALLLTVAGDDALEIYNNFTFGDDESRESYVTVIAKFDTYCAEQLNEVHERYLFRQRVQGQGEPVEQFVRELRKMSRSCNFGTTAESFIRDQIVFGTNDDKVRQKLLQDKKLTLAKAEEVCKAAEMTAAQNEIWSREQRQIDAVKLRECTKQQQCDERPAMFKCRRCGRTHGPRSCPAFGKVCRKCQGQNHFAVRCKVNRQVREVRGTENSEEEFDILDVSVNSVGRSCDRDWVVRAQVADTAIDFKVDTGSQANLVPFSAYKKLQPRVPLARSNCVLRSYNGGVIKHLGVMTTTVAVGSKTAKINFFIVKKNRHAILGLRASELLGLFSRTVNDIGTSNSEAVVHEFQQLFSGTGCIKRPYRIVLREDAVPVVQTARRVPLSLKEPLREELDRMVKAGIIAKQDQPTDWVNAWWSLTCCLERPSKAQKQTSTMTWKFTRSSPLEDGQSPGELLQGRRLRTTLPDFNEAHRQSVKKHEQYRTPRRSLAPLQKGQVVRVRGDSWSPKAKILNATAQPRSYQVATEDGDVLRRNRQHLMATAEPFSIAPSDDDIPDDSHENGSPCQVQSNNESAPAITPPTREPRRSQRERRQPQRLRYDDNFVQVP
ncbi:uncharacterized protein [Dermacentor albipictus]|uniref:uncharacterized protein n=1 Tax=Dermacentor albipictus TaxID=60249 RepID=UPI0038FCB2F4